MPYRTEPYRQMNGRCGIATMAEGMDQQEVAVPTATNTAKKMEAENAATNTGAG